MNLRPLAFVLATAAAAACSVDADLAGKRCPCADGWQCDTTTSRCVPNGVALTSTAPAGPVDIVVPDRLRVTQGSGVTLTVAPAQPDMGTFQVAVESPADVAVTPASATIAAPATAAFDIRPTAAAALGVVTLVVRAYRASGDEWVRKEVALEIAGKPGSADVTFGTNGTVVTDVAGPRDEAASDDGLFVTTVPGDNGFRCEIYRIFFDGRHDASFGQNPLVLPMDDCDVEQSAGVPTVVALADRGASFPTHASIALERFDARGAPDPAFNGGAPRKFAVGTDNVVDAMALAPDGGAIVAARSGSGAAALFRFDAAGAPVATFGSGGQRSLGTFLTGPLRVTANGAVLVAGRDGTTTPGSIELRRYASDGTPDAAFGDGGVITLPNASGQLDISTIAVGPDERVFVFASDPATRKPAVHAFHPTGKVDASFGTNGVATPSAGVAVFRFRDAAVLEDGSIVAAAEDPNGAVLARFDATGHADDDFDGHAQFPGGFLAHHLFVLEGKLLVTGAVTVTTDAGSANVLALARYWR